MRAYFSCILHHKVQPVSVFYSLNSMLKDILNVKSFCSPFIYFFRKPKTYCDHRHAPFLHLRDEFVRYVALLLNTSADLDCQRDIEDLWGRKAHSAHNMSFQPKKAIIHSEICFELTLVAYSHTHSNKNKHNMIAFSEKKIMGKMLYK